MTDAISTLRAIILTYARLGEWIVAWRTVMQVEGGPLVLMHTTERGAMNYAEHWTRAGYDRCEVFEIRERRVAEYTGERGEN